MRVLVTGGAGFIGCNSVKTLMDRGDEVIVFDNLCRKGASRNLRWLQDQGKFTFIRGDIRRYEEILGAMKAHGPLDAVLHLASQVAVTTSVTDPRHDFETNALGTFNVVEAVRNSGSSPVLIYSSTNKVYGGMEDIEIVRQGNHYLYKDHPEGISEEICLDFHSPYGCSKGAGDQYVRDYARIYGLRTVVFRQSCIYGRRQFGVEDQGWLAWFTIASVLGRSISIYGDGMQVRDILWVDDLVAAYLKAIDRADKVAGRIYNIGGGRENAMAIWSECGAILEELLGRKVDVHYADWRPGDQRCCILDCSRAKRELDWAPKVSAREGVKLLYEWVRKNIDEIREEFA